MTFYFLHFLGNAEDLDLHSNMFSGFIPSSIVNAVNISYIDLSENKIRGSIPAQLYDTSLEFLYLSTNELTGPVSSGLKNMVGLKELGLDSNMLTGTIPMEVGSLINAGTLMTAKRYICISMFCNDMAYIVSCCEFSTNY